MMLVRAGFVTAAASASRILGFVRDLLLAQALGAGPVADAFLAAFRLPNLLRRLLSEGGLNPALIPLLASSDPESAKRLAGEAFAVTALLLVGLVALVEATAGIAVFVFAPGLFEDETTRRLAALYTRVGFPLVVGVTLASLLGAVLNAQRRYLATSLSLLVVNVALILCLLAFKNTSLVAQDKGLWLAAVSSIAGFVQCAWVALAFAGRDRPIVLTWPRLTPSTRKFLRHAALALLVGSAMPLFVLVGTQVASFLPSGVSWLYYADRLLQLPVGIMAAVAGTVLLPELALHHGEGRRAAVIEAQNRALEMSWLLSLPAAVGLGILAEPIIFVLFQRGAFSASDSLGTARILQGLCLGLPFAAAGKIVAQTLFARQSFRALVVALVVGLIATLIACLVLGLTMGIAGLGLGISGACAAHLFVMVRGLRLQGFWQMDKGLVRSWVKSAGGSVVLAGGLVCARRFIEIADTATLLGFCGGGILLYGGLCWAFGLVPARSSRSLAAKRLR